MIIRYFFSSLLILALMLSSYATHIRGGEIIVKRINQFSFTYRISVVGYRDIGSSITFGGGTLRLGDSTIVEGPFETAREPVDNGIEKVTFSYIHTYGNINGTGYLISYEEDYRNDGIINIDNSVGTPFYTETLLIIDPALGINNTPIFTVPISEHAYAFIGHPYVHNPGVFDPDGDSLSFSLAVPQKGMNTPVDNYRYPSHPDFYSDFDHSSESGGKPTFKILSDGTVIWDSPGDVSILINDLEQREYNFAIKVTEWRKFNGEWIKIGHSVREMQVVVMDYDIDYAHLLPINMKYTVPIGENFNQTFSSTPMINEYAAISAYGEPLTLGYATTSLGKSDYTSIEWIPNCDQFRETPYRIYFNTQQTNGEKNNLGPGHGPYSGDLKMVDFFVTPETVKNLHLNSNDKDIFEVSWDSYDNLCDKAENLILTRRISDTQLRPQHYNMDELNSLGIEVLGEALTNETAYIKPLAINPGATYAYSVMVKYGSNLVSSQEESITYSLSAPVIHQVDVVNENQIDLAWLGPNQVINNIAHPIPFKYKVLRAQDGETEYQVISENLIDTKMTDTDVIFTSSINQYNYKVICYDNNDIVIDTSLSVSSIKLMAESTDFGIQLDWSANASYNINNTKQYIYRKQADLSDDSFDLIDSLVLKGPKRLSYLDKSGLVRETSYCYMISASSTYGNPIIPESTIRSQSSCVLYTPLITKPVIEKLEIQVYPNPVFNSLTIKSRESVDINIFDLSGSSVLNKENLSSGLNEIKLEIPSGVYILQVQNRNGQTYSERIIKK